MLVIYFLLKLLKRYLRNQKVLQMVVTYDRVPREVH